MVAAKVMSAQTGRDRLAKLGVQFASNEAVIIAQEAALNAEAATPTDPLAERVAAELATLGGAASEDTPAGDVAAS
jgi:predicted regulator of Ras-like GTPase activity (Roadblock/LC7/MglB family)